MPPSKTGTIRIGISGWRYTPWRGNFYPKKLPQNQELAYASKILSSIEINGTFYSLQRPTSFESWAADTPDNFVFSLKGPRFITHMRRLREAKIPLANFFASGVLLLGKKLGPVLWQLPPNFLFDAKRLEDFFAVLPRDTTQAASLARKHDKWLKKRASTVDPAPHALRHAIEVRHKSFAVPEFIKLLKKHDIALVCADSVEWPRMMDLTSDFVYCRLHGSEELYASGYDDETLDRWAVRVVDWANGREPRDAERILNQAGAKRKRDVFVYFDNDKKVRAPVDAQSLVKRTSKSK
jgi:uncharacterized protein YecE (DUF72 family)